MIYLKKLPEKEKSPEKCCPSVKEGNRYINPWPSAVPKAKKFNYNLWNKRMYDYFTSSIVAREKNQNLKVDLDLPTITKYYEDINYNNNIKIQVTWLGHSAFLVQINSFTLLFDPFLSRRASPINFIGPYRCRDRGFESFSELPPVDFIVLSHNHYDHLDKATIKEIFSVEKNKKTHIFCPLELKSWFLGLGIPENQVTECDWWDEYEITKLPESFDISNETQTQLNETLTSNNNTTTTTTTTTNNNNNKINIIAVPAQHFSGRTGLDYNTTLWVGWVIKNPETSCYFVGDTGYRAIPDNCTEEEREKYPYCPIFKTIGELYGPFDIATIPIGPVTPANRMSINHTSANDAVNIHIDCKSKHSIPMHWGTAENLSIDSIESGPAELHEELKKKNIPLEEFQEVFIGQVYKIEKHAS